MNKNTIASKKTVNHLIRIARRHFSTDGYDKTSLLAIVQEADMTRGALYHHFKNKKALFLAVLEQVQSEIGQAVESKAMQSSDVWEQLILGCVGYVETATLKSNRRILLIDSLTVVDWEEWRRMDNENSVSHLIDQLETIAATGMLVDLDPTIIAHLISGALNDLALHLAQDSTTANPPLENYVSYLVKGFKKDEH